MNARELVYGAAAGAAGTAVLNAATYADMLLRDRPPSKVPQRVVQHAAHAMGIDRVSRHRRTALGAMLGYADGFGTGALFGSLRPTLMRNTPWFAAGLMLAAGTMLLSEGTATLLGETDPREWTFSDWAADIVPRCLFGWVTALTFDSLWENEV